MSTESVALEGVSSVKQQEEKHSEIQKCIQKDYIQTQLIFLEEGLALLHFDVEQAWTLDAQELGPSRDPAEDDQAAEPHEVVGCLLLEGHCAAES